MMNAPTHTVAERAPEVGDQIVFAHRGPGIFTGVVIKADTFMGFVAQSLHGICAAIETGPYVLLAVNQSPVVAPKSFSYEWIDGDWRCIHPGLFANSDGLDVTQKCGHCDTDVPNREL